MNKLHLHREFIELRASGYTFDEICTKLKITKPTTIAWGKKFAEQIDESQNYLLIMKHGPEIVKRNETFILYCEQFRRINESKPATEAGMKGAVRMTKRLNALFGGYKDLIANIEGKNVFKFLKHELSEVIFTFSKKAKEPNLKSVTIGGGEGVPSEKLLQEMAKVLERIERRRK